MQNNMTSEIRSGQTPPETLDDLLVRLKFSTRYYSAFIFMIILVYINDSISCSLYIFTADKVNYWCADERFANDSCASLDNSSDVCAEWVYEDPHSFVAEFQLACEEWKRTLVGTAQGFGYGIALLIIGPLSDRIGRKTLVVFTATMCGIVGVAKSFCSNYWLFIILEFLGAGIGNCYSPAYILLMEMVAHEKRVLTQTLCSLGTLSGKVIISLAAWICPYWRHLLMVLYGPAVIFISFAFFLDESPRWLLSKGEKDKAMAILEKTANSKSTFNRSDIDKLPNLQHDKVAFIKSVMETFGSNILVKRFILCLIWWTACVYVNYGLRINSVLLPGNKYLNFGLLGIAELPGRILTFWLLKKFTRKANLISCFFFCGVVCIVQPFMPENSSWMPILLFLVGKMLATIVFSVTYIFTSELFPTYVRNSTHALCSSISRLGSVLAPLTPLLLVYWHGLPALTFGAASLIAGVVALLAPASADAALPATVQQAEVLGAKPAAAAPDPAHNVELSLHDIIEAGTIPRDFRGVLTMEMTKRRKSLKKSLSMEITLPSSPITQPNNE